jgi:hypothetical protein
MGKPKYIETPEKMWEYFQEYKIHTKNNPIKVNDFRGGVPMEVFLEKERPLTLEGFEMYCFENGIISDLSHYFCNLDNRYSDYVAICSRIRKAIREDQITGGMAGIYNPSITQRLNNLVERTEVKEVKEQPLFPDVHTNDSDKQNT